MDWVILVVSGAMEAVWAQALDRSEGFTQLAPSIVFIVALAASMLGLSHAVRTIPLGTAYAVWVGIGTVVANRTLGDAPEPRRLCDCDVPHLHPPLSAG